MNQRELDALSILKSYTEQICDTNQLNKTLQSWIPKKQQISPINNQQIMFYSVKKNQIHKSTQKNFQNIVNPYNKKKLCESILVGDVKEYPPAIKFDRKTSQIQKIDHVNLKQIEYPSIYGSDNRNNRFSFIEQNFQNYRKIYQTKNKSLGPLIFRRNEILQQSAIIQDVKEKQKSKFMNQQPLRKPFLQQKQLDEQQLVDILKIGFNYTSFDKKNSPSYNK